MEDTENPTQILFRACIFHTPFVIAPQTLFHPAEPQNVEQNSIVEIYSRIPMDFHYNTIGYKQNSNEKEIQRLKLRNHLIFYALRMPLEHKRYQYQWATNMNQIDVARFKFTT